MREMGFWNQAKLQNKIYEKPFDLCVKGHFPLSSCVVA